MNKRSKCISNFWKYYIWYIKSNTGSTASKVSNYGVFLVRIFLYSNWIRRFTEYRKTRTRKNYLFGHFSCSDRLKLSIHYFLKLNPRFWYLEERLIWFHQIPILLKFSWNLDWQHVLTFARGIEIKLLPNTVGTTSLTARICKLQVLIETDTSLSKKYRKYKCLSLYIMRKNLSRSLFILSPKVLPLYTQISNSYRVIRKNCSLFMKTTCRELWRDHGYFFDITAWKWVQKKKVKVFSILNVFLVLYMLCTKYPIDYRGFHKKWKLNA